MSGAVTKVNLFNLHRTVTTYELKNEDGTQVSVIALKALTYSVSQQLSDLLAQYRLEAEKAATANDLSSKILARVKDMSPASIIELILTMERSTALDNADLTPLEGKTSEQQDEAAIAAYNERRRPELEAIAAADEGRGVLNALYVSMQTRMLSMAQAVNRYLNTQLIYMVVDPETEQPIFSEDPSAENFIGNLMPETRDQLNEYREQFLMSLTEKALRRATENPTSPRSGRLRRQRRVSPGGTTETPSTSPPLMSDSSVAVSG